MNIPSRIILFLAPLLLAGCTSTSGTPSVDHSPMADLEEGDDGPQGLILDNSGEIRDVTPVREMPFGHYRNLKASGSLIAEEATGGYVYYGTSRNRLVDVNGSSTWVKSIERYRSRIP